ncbi:hypothetical protein CAEBREN_30292 [Caenorhabditis brenneri]|uniref:Chondroitin proteoglycan 4 domain-containing protein n=1 Tax=Caenorhabditis brenneri TaxID=135651 RepID=G0NXI9_CAEBE|nr:hypothetical protein CAEBREN_30292 [Caenorhabditis brenneri]
MQNTLNLLTFVLLSVAFIDGAVNPVHEDVVPHDVDTIFRALGVPNCARKCIDPFLWNMKNMVNQTETFCSQHAQAITCLEKEQSCDPKKIFSKASSSVEYMCSTKRAVFHRMKDCLSPIVDDVMSACDEKCYLRSNLTALAQKRTIKNLATVGGDALLVAEYIEPLCSSVQCILPCVTKRLNNECPLSGWLTLDMLLQPFDAFSVMFKQPFSLLQRKIHSNIGERCSFMVRPIRLDRIRNGDFRGFT